MTWMTILGHVIKEVAVPLLLEAGRKIISDMGKSESVNQKSTVDEVAQSSESMLELKNYVQQQSQQQVREANNAVMTYIEQQLTSLEKQSALLSKYNISAKSVQRRMADIKSELDLETFWADELNRRISIDNPQFTSILKLPSGAKKTNEIQRLTNQILSETFDKYFNRLRKKLEEIYNDFEEEVEHTVSQLEKTVAEYNEMVQSLDDKDDDKYEQLIAKAQTKIASYEAILNR